ncbi:hypothetical protein [Hymenobacter persicinus]|uniref:Uncharacterized protein n=1 Tax=Hymenobacter persicinus TaxID=2025506 RepID=A0A4Q5LD87_9BACT|nr:hypothetical protein [Hymenobacter persicinus]RYU79536.1 hypothetical protein EWM57_10225 [Hymenobacter persicinus]
MHFEQRQLTRITRLALGPHGLHVRQSTRGGRTVLEFEMPYEEVLPVRLERTDLAPALKNLPFVVLWLLLASLAHAAQQPGGLSATGWSWAAGAAVLVGGYLLGPHTWWRRVSLRTARATVSLPDRRRSREELTAFANALDHHCKAYLREHYAAINPLGLIEPQVQRLLWLRQLNVVSEAEARALTTRLTGQVADAQLTSLGLTLEMPYVN